MKTPRKFVLITGVSTGIGKDAIAFLIDKGYYVIGSVRKETDVVRLSEQYPQNFSCLRFDVTKVEEIKSAYHELVQILQGERLSGLVNNAGLAIGGPIELLDDDKFRYQMDVNLFAVRNVTNIFLPLLKGDRKKGIQGGKIIMISSLSGIFNTPFNGAYCISKHAMESLGEIYRRELMMYNIDVVSIQSGPIQSKIWDKNIDKYEAFSDTDYGKLMGRANKVMKEAQKQALAPRVISKLIYTILSRRTKLHFIVNKNWLATVFFVKYIPARWIDRYFYRQFFK